MRWTIKGVQEIENKGEHNKCSEKRTTKNRTVNICVIVPVLFDARKRETFFAMTKIQSLLLPWLDSTSLMPNFVDCVFLSNFFLCCLFPSVAVVRLMSARHFYYIYMRVYMNEEKNCRFVSDQYRNTLCDTANIYRIQ